MKGSLDGKVAWAGFCSGPESESEPQGRVPEGIMSVLQDVGLKSEGDVVFLADFYI